MVLDSIRRKPSTENPTLSRLALPSFARLDGRGVRPYVIVAPSEHLYVERQVFLGIFPDRFHQFARLHQHLVAVVVESWILE